MLRPTGRRPPKQTRSAPDSRPADAGGGVAADHVFLASVTSERQIMSPKYVDMSMLYCVLSVVSRATRANTIRRGTRKEAGITRPCHVLKVVCSTFGL